MGRPISRKYTAKEVDRGLLAVAFCGGNQARASRILKEQGLDISRRLLHKWVNEIHIERYFELAAAHHREIEDTIIVDMRQKVVAYGALEAQAIEESAKQLAAGTVKDASTVARNAAVGKGINNQNLLVLSGRPSEIHETRSSDDLVRSLQRALSVDGSAEEIPPTTQQLEERNSHATHRRKAS